MVRDEAGNVLLRIPRRDSSMVRVVSRVFKLPPYRTVALDELGTFVIEHCDGRHSVREIVEAFTRRFKLNRREAEVSMAAFLRTLGRKAIIGFIIEANEGSAR